MKRNFLKFIAMALLLTTAFVACKKTISVTGVTLDKSTLSLEVDKQATLTATVSPEDAENKNITWTSNNPAIAGVENGVVKAKAVGTAKITVTTEDGKFTATCEVTVTPKIIPQKTYKIGDSYNENGVQGIVFRVDASGKKGTIIALTYDKGKFCWSLESEVTGATSETDGEANMRYIQTIANWPNNYPAFKCANNHNKPEAGINGWYLPVPSEVKDILDLRDKINSSLRALGKPEIEWVHNLVYWSSTEHNASTATALYKAGDELQLVQSYPKSAGSEEDMPGEEPFRTIVFAVKKFDVTE